MVMRDNNTPAMHVVFEGVGVTIQWDSWDRIENRCSWGYRVYDASSMDRHGDPVDVLAEGSDLRTAGDRSLAFEAFEALIGFMEAWAESWDRLPPGDNAGLFPAAMWDASHDWATWCFHVRTYICGPAADGEAATQIIEADSRESIKGGF